MLCSGDTVKIKNKEDMIKQYGDILDKSPGFVEDMVKFCGQEFTIKDMNPDSGFISFEELITTDFTWNTWMVEFVKKENKKENMVQSIVTKLGEKLEIGDKVIVINTSDRGIVVSTNSKINENTVIIFTNNELSNFTGQELFLEEKATYIPASMVFQIGDKVKTISEIECLVLNPNPDIDGELKLYNISTDAVVYYPVHYLELVGRINCNGI